MTDLKPNSLNAQRRQEAPARHAIAMPCGSVEQTVDEFRLLLGSAETRGQRQAGTHLNKSS